MELFKHTLWIDGELEEKQYAFYSEIFNKLEETINNLIKDQLEVFNFTIEKIDASDNYEVSISYDYKKEAYTHDFIIHLDGRGMEGILDKLDEYLMD